MPKNQQFLNLRHIRVALWANNAANCAGTPLAVTTACEVRPREAVLKGLFNQSATLKLEKYSNGAAAIIRLIGRLHMHHIEELARLLQGDAARTVIDLQEVTLVDLEVVRFFVACEARGVQIETCSAYIHQWMIQERLCGPPC
jgi:hypothetical protein